MLINIPLFIMMILVIIHQRHGLPISSKKRPPDENPDLFEGDIRFPKTSPSVRGVLRRGDSIAWASGIVPYEISSEYEPREKAYIIDVMQKMERDIAINNVKCIEFRPRISSDQYYITIRDGDGTCSSFVGQNTGVDMERTVTLSTPQCLSQGLVMHELLHVLGFYHEQSRPDRDDYIKVNYANIKPGMEDDFQKYDNSHVNTQYTPYDYSSVMHYGSYAFSSNDFPTIEPLDPTASIGQRWDMSPIDIEEVRLFYNCQSDGITLPTIPTSIKVNTTISSSLTINSPTFDRVGTTSNRYYYEAYEIYVSSEGDYTFISNSSIDTYGYLYEEDFNPNDVYENLMTLDDGGGEISQFRLIDYLLVNVKYILVISTYYPLVTGDYQLIVFDSPSVNIKKLNNLPTQRTTTVPLVTTTARQDISTYSNALTTNSLRFTRHRGNGLYYYEAITLCVSKYGRYSFQSNSTIDSYGYLYMDRFDPSEPMDDLLLFDDDRAGNLQFLITYNLEPNEKNILIMTTSQTNEIGSFSIIASGPGTVQFNCIDNPTPSPTQYISTYISALTSDSLTFSGYEQDGTFYYEAITICPSTDGLYSFQSSSTIDSYGLLYIDTFDPSEPMKNILIDNDDDGTEDSQFLITYDLDSNEKYVLIMTSYEENAITSFSITASGAGTVQFNCMSDSAKTN